MGIDVPEFLAKYPTEAVKAVGDYDLIEFYYLLQVGEYTVKEKRNDMKQTVQFKLEDEMFFCRYAKGSLNKLPINALR